MELPCSLVVEEEEGEPSYYLVVEEGEGEPPYSLVEEEEEEELVEPPYHLVEEEGEEGEVEVTVQRLPDFLEEEVEGVVELEEKVHVQV